MHKVTTAGTRDTFCAISALALIGTLGVCVPVSAQSQDTSGTQKGPDDKAHPLGGQGLKIEAGYRRLFGTSADSVYYDLKYLGQTLTQRGKAFNDAQGYNQLPEFRNDSPQLAFTLERGIRKTDGPLAKYLQLARLPKSNDIRFVFQGYGALDNGSSLGFGAGIETKPLSFRATDVPNFLTIGAQYGTQPVTDPANSNRTNQSETGVIAYRQYIAYARLDANSDFRQKVKDFAESLPDNIPVSISEFYTGAIDGNISVVANLATTEQARKALAKLDDKQKKTLVQDLTYSAPFSISTLSGVAPLSVGASIRAKLTAASEETPLGVLKKGFDTAGVSVLPPIPDWITNDKKTLLVAEKFTEGGGLVATDNPSSATSDVRKAAVQKYAESLKLSDLTEIDKLIDLAYRPNQSPSKHKQFLTVANRLLLEQLLPEIRGYGTNITGLKPTLLNLYHFNDRSTSVLLIENTGQYYFTGNPGNGSNSRLNHLFAASFTYYLNPGADQRNFLRLRYENGRDRANPNPYLNQLTLSAGIEF